MLSIKVVTTHSHCILWNHRQKQFPQNEKCQWTQTFEICSNTSKSRTEFVCNFYGCARYLSKSSHFYPCLFANEGQTDGNLKFFATDFRLTNENGLLCLLTLFFLPHILTHAFRKIKYQFSWSIFIDDQWYLFLKKHHTHSAHKLYSWLSNWDWLFTELN